MPITIPHAHAAKVSHPCRIYDAQRGLHLWVKSNTAKYWVFRSSKTGRRIEISLGPFPQISVQEARRRATELSSKAANGVDLIAERKASKQKAVDEPRVTFAEFAATYIQSQRPSWRNAKHADR